jgi:DNA repair photolyase
VDPILYQNPIAMFQGMWATGIYLNCNVYHSCTTGCRYCYVALNRKSEARRQAERDCTSPFHGLSKLTGILNKVFSPRCNEQNATEYFLRERWPMMLSNNSDPLSALELEHGFTYQYLSVLADLEYPVQILTKGQAWHQLDKEKWIALFKRFPRLWVSVTITADNDECRAEWEPNGSSIDDRFSMVEELTREGIACEVHCTPFIPSDSFRSGPWDDIETYRPFIQRVKAAGAFGVTLAPLCFDSTDARVLDRESRAYCTAQQWCNSTTDKPWRLFLPDVSIWECISRLWYSEAKSIGLQCGLHPSFVSLCGDGNELDSSCCTPAWVDKSGSWINTANRLRRAQDEHKAPIILWADGAAEYQTRKVPYNDHEFSWSSWLSQIPHSYRDAGYEARIASMPKYVRAEDVVSFQLQEMCRWSDSLWVDQCVAPATLEKGTQLVDDCGNLLVTYDRSSQRDSWAVCRTGHGWDGRTQEDLASAVTADGQAFFEEEEVK